jgi:cell division protein FtsZ
MGYAVMGTASASGPKRTIEAAQKAIASPLLEAGAIDGARGILINITGSSSLKLSEVQQACSIIQSAAHEDANIIFGAVMDEKMKDAVKITVIATGFREAPSARPRPIETHMSFSSRHAAALDSDNAHANTDPMDFPNGAGPRNDMPEHIMSSHTAFEDRSANVRDYAADVVPVPLAHVPERVAADVISLDSMRDNLRGTVMTNFEQDDLDVPAFLRKRNEVM